MKTAEQYLQEYSDNLRGDPRVEDGYFHELQVLEIMKGFSEQFIPKKESLEERKQKFINRVAEFKNDYPRPMLVDFVGYWLEISDNGKKYRFEKEKVFEISKRLVRWSKNNKNARQDSKINSLTELKNQSVANLLG